MPDNRDIIVSFREALEWAEKRGVVLPRSYYEDLPVEARAVTFTISYIEKVGIIQQILDSLAESLDSGLSFAEWRELPIIPALESLQPFHVETVYRNFLQNAFQKGHWDQIEKGMDDRPYLLYSAILDGRETELCHGLNGTIRRADDPFWDIYAPPNHHNCRSSIVTLTPEQAERRSADGKGLYAEPPTDDMGNKIAPPKGWDVSPKVYANTLSRLLGNRIGDLSSISPDLADLFVKMRDMI